jgi:hypothetical protein
MAKRQFRDERALIWDVWDVFPADVPSRLLYDRRTEARPADAAGEPTAEAKRFLDSELEQGWLCFQRGTERRRCAPIPVKWFELPDGVLRVMLDIASPVATAVSNLRLPATDAP